MPVPADQVVMLQNRDNIDDLAAEPLSFFEALRVLVESARTELRRDPMRQIVITRCWNVIRYISSRD
jgi:hypothetical protein